MKSVNLKSSAFFILLMLAGDVFASNLSIMRSDYQKAERYLEQNKMDQFKLIRKQLNDYALTPYLDYRYFQKMMHKVSRHELIAFHEKYYDFPYRKQLYSQYLSMLAARSDWKNYRKEYETLPLELDSAELQCHYLNSLYQTGAQKQALQYVNPLWEVDSSQPKACDPIFAAWMKSDLYSHEYAWKRVSMVIQSGNSGLANYLIREFLPGKYQEQAKLYLQVKNNPAILLDSVKFKQNNTHIREIIQFGITKLIRKEPETAIKLWNQYLKVLTFTPDEIKKTESTIALQLAKRYDESALSWLKRANHHFEDEELNDWHLRVLVRQMAWQEYLAIYQQMPASIQTEESWRYWQARAIESTKPNKTQQKLAHDIYQDLARERSFYGFLSAYRLGLDYALNDKKIDISQDFLNKMSARGNIVRAKEFKALGQISNARREWHHMIRNELNDAELLAAAKIAQNWNWPDQGIWSLIVAKAWDHLDIRFPIVYQDLIKRYARENGLDPAWVFAITRQESAFRADARSHSNALGLMQLLPSTAKDTAKKIKFNLKSNQMLLQPENNIPLGSAYLSMMAKRFNGNRFLASAAYNAGPNRVSRWLRQAGHLPFDAWIETIPFNETRNYVQNVLSFNVIYAKKLGIKKVNFILPNEKQLAETMASN